MSHFATCLARSRSPSGSSAPWAAGGRQERSDLRCADLARVASPSATRSPSLPKFGKAWSPSESSGPTSNSRRISNLVTSSSAPLPHRYPTCIRFGSRFAVHCQALRGRLRRCRLWPGRSSRVYGDQLPVLMEFWRARVLASKGKKHHAVVDRSVRVCKSTYGVNDIVPLVSLQWRVGRDAFGLDVSR